MKKSKAETAETRLRIISIASDLFLKRGLAETSISDIMAASGLTQGGFYRHFASKNQLVAEANRAANEELFEYYSAAIADMEPARAVQTLVQLYLNQGCGPGGRCPLAHLASELRHSDSEIRAVALEGRSRLLGVIAGRVAQLGVPDAAGVADAIVSAAVGAVALAYLADDAAAAAIRAHALRAVSILLGSGPAARLAMAA